MPWLRYCGRDIEMLRRPTLEEFGAEMGAQNEMLVHGPFWRGRLFLLGEEMLGEVEAVSVLDPDWPVVWSKNIALCRRIPHKETVELSYSHHAEVAYLPPVTRRHLLNFAVKEGLKVKDLRQKVREVRGK